MSNTLATATPKKLTTKALLSSENMQKQFSLALPKHLSAERFTRIALTALTRTPKLAECSQESLMKCLLDLSAFGLEPDGRRAHLIPYENRKLGIVECQLILDWKGLAELALRSGMISKLHSDVVCENDAFDFNMGEIATHRINFREDRGAVYAAYALAVTKDGNTFCQVLSRKEIDAVRARSRSGNSGPWVSDFAEMAKKTAFRRLAKWLPLSAEFRDALERDEEDLREREPLDVTPVKPTSSRLFASVAQQALPEAQQALPEAQQALPEAQPALPEAQPLVQQDLVEVASQTLLQQAEALIARDKVDWDKIAPALHQQAMTDALRSKVEDCSEQELSSIVGAWTQIAAYAAKLAAKKGGSK